ncbi:MAG: Flp pilus assembly protein CpaB [Paracoccaceae bacterium]
MRMIFGLVLIVGIALAGAAVYMVRGFFEGSETALATAEAKLAKIGPLEKVYVVKKGVNYGASITRDDVQMIYWQKAALPEGTFSDIDAMFPENGPKERYVLRQMDKFEPVLASKVTEPGKSAGLINQLGVGVQAFAIRVDATTGVSGLVHPGDHVDVFWTGNAPGVDGELTRLIESAVKVVAVDQSTDGDRSPSGVARTVTIAAGREQVARLVQAQATGRMSLSLVSGAEDAEAGLVEVDSKGMLGIQEQQVVEAPKEQVCTIKTRKGSDIVETPIPCTN